jgi:hypothetical protein
MIVMMMMMMILTPTAALGFRTGGWNAEKSMSAAVV